VAALGDKDLNLSTFAAAVAAAVEHAEGVAAEEQVQGIERYMYIGCPPVQRRKYPPVVTSG
jgi:hypothetical protein